ncbi:hypothetical protein [Falsiroseomonas oryzae]|nr:hypothetical protein [Roseomonas sp. MO-31]
MSTARSGSAIRRHAPWALMLLRGGALLAGMAIVLVLSGLGRIG